MKRILCTHVFAAAALAPLGAAQAAVVNGSFESGLLGWSTLGDVSVQAMVGSVGAAQGAAQLALTTASLAYADDAPSGAGAFNLSGVDTAPAGGALEVFAGLVAGGLDPDPANAVQAFEGSAARQAFHASAGEVLSLRFDFLTNDALAGDYAFVAIDGTLFKLADRSGAAAAAGAWAWHTGYGSFSHRFTSSGVHTLAFGVVDVGDFIASSALLVDAVHVGAVPEAETYALMLLGLGAMGLGIRGRTRRGRAG